MRKEKYREEREVIEETKKSNVTAGEKKQERGPVNDDGATREMWMDRSPGDVHGRRASWRAAGRVHGVFRVVLRRTDGAAVP